MLARRDHLFARHGRADRRHALSRRFRGAPEVGGQGDRERIQGAILFIDEIHTVIGAGATSGGAMDASNLLKPALPRARCAASARPPTRNTASISRRTARSCAASRRSTCNEPSVPDAIEILKGLKPYFEEYPQGPLHLRRGQGGGRAVGANTSTTASCPTRRST